MDDVSQVVAAIIGRSEGVRANGEDISIVFLKPRSGHQLTNEMFAMPLPQLVRAVSKALTDGSR